MDAARTAALDALLHVDVEEGYSNLVLDKTLRAYGLRGRDASLASALFYGVLERRIPLDWVLRKFSKTPLEKLSPAVLGILRIALYQILYMDKIPASAAVNEAVNCAKENKKTAKASGFVNGVLRSVLRSGDPMSLLPGEEDPVLAASVRYSCPEWILRLWQNAYGAEITQGLLESLSQHPPVYVRVNTTRTSAQSLCALLEQSGVRAQAVPWLPDALMLEGTGAIAELPAYQQGLFHVQDLSSQLVCGLLGAKPGERIIDVCAAPGGKSFTIAQRMENRGELLSFDLYKKKAGLIRQGAQRLGLPVIRAGVRDAANPEKPLEPADRVLCDAPCSGLGIIRRKPEIRYKPEESIRGLPEIQRGILDRTAELVRPGGVLLYSTCTLHPAENARTAAYFLERHPEFEPLPLKLPEGVARAIAEPENQLTLFPHIHKTDGFFAALFRRRA